MNTPIKKYTEVDWEKVLLMLMPPLLRKSRHVTWLYVMLKPLSNLYEDTLYKMQHNGQVIYMEKVLNELFNKRVPYTYSETTQEKANKGLIFIDDSDRPAVQYLFTNNEIKYGGEPAILTYTQNPDEKKDFRYFLYLASDLDLSSTDYFNFRINIPDAILESNNSHQREVKSIARSTQSIQKKQQFTENISEKLIYEQGHPYNNHPDAVNIRTPRFHKVVNFYKLVAKSYETRRYAKPETEPSDTMMLLR